MLAEVIAAYRDQSPTLEKSAEEQQSGHQKRKSQGGMKMEGAKRRAASDERLMDEMESCVARFSVCLAD